MTTKIKPTSSSTTEVARDHDVIAIGCGPFNLGLAALASTVPDLDLIVLDANPEVTWHRGIMLDNASMQVNFLADLVTLVAPSHPLSYLAYLHDMDRLYTFTVRENFFPLRKEYESYLRWAAAKLTALRFSHRVENVHWDNSAEMFVLRVVRSDDNKIEMRARNIVLGIGTAPHLPPALQNLPQEKILHSSEYVYRESDLADAQKVSVIGSGQSGAEVVRDLIRRNLARGPAISWLTRTHSFAPLDYSKLVLEMTTPGYMQYFHSLSGDIRDQLIAEQWQLHKGISMETLDDIHELLYQRQLEEGLDDVEIRFGVTVEHSEVNSNGKLVLSCRHRDTNQKFDHTTDVVVAATGYRNRPPDFLTSVRHLIRYDNQGRFVVRADHSIELADGVVGRIFVANAEIHSHGVSAPNLDIGAIRNATIINAISGRECYRLPKRSGFTQFSPPLKQMFPVGEVRTSD